MEYYNYKDAMKEDIIAWMEDTETTWEDRDELHDILWTEDSVTGNASGSYTCNAGQAQEYVLGDPDAEDYIRDMISEFCIEPETIAEHLFDWEYWDVSIRCWLLSQVLYDMDDEELHL